MNAMRRSSRWRRGRRSDSRSTAPATERATTNLIAVPDARRPLSDGLVVEASVVARLFRVRLLAIDASVVISPARVHGRVPAVRRDTHRRIGAGLVAAERFIDEGASSLATARATGTTTSAR